MGLVVRNRKKTRPLVSTDLRTGNCAPAKMTWVMEEGLAHPSQFQAIYKHCLRWHPTCSRILGQILIWVAVTETWCKSTCLVVCGWTLVSQHNRRELCRGGSWGLGSSYHCHKAVVDVRARIFQKVDVSSGGRHELVLLWWCRADDSESAETDQCCRICGRCDACQEIGMNGGIAAEPGGTGNTFGSADSQPPPRALRWLDLTHVNSTETSCNHKGLRTGSWVSSWKGTPKKIREEGLSRTVFLSSSAVE